MTVSPLRSALRARLTIAMRERDHHAVSAIRSALAAVENAEAVPTDGSLAATSSGRVAGAVLGVGAAEARRRELSAADEVALVRAEVADLRDAARHRRGVGDADAADRREAAASLLEGVIGDVDESVARLHGDDVVHRAG
jgi:hypothetical protein